MSNKLFQFPLTALFSILAVHGGFSQSTTLEVDKPASQRRSVEEVLPQNAGGDVSQYTFNRVMIVPFDEKMYNSQIDRELSAFTSQTYTQLMECFRKGIANLLFIEAKTPPYGWSPAGRHSGTAFSSFVMYPFDTTSANDLEYIYESIAYEHKLMPPDSSPTTQPDSPKLMFKKLKEKTKFIENMSNEKPGTVIKNGELYTVNGNKERYMSTKITQKAMLPYILRKYETDYFLFVNEMDIFTVQGRNRGDYQRMVKIHYTLLDKFGDELDGGAVRTCFPATVNEPRDIINTHLSPLAKKMTCKLPAGSLVGNPKEYGSHSERQ